MALCIQEPEAELPGSIVLLRCLAIPKCCFCVVLRYPMSILIQLTKLNLCVWLALLRCLAIPEGSLYIVLRKTLAA